MSTASLTEDLPRWDMTNVYSGLEGADYLTGMQRLEADLGALEKFCDERGVRRLDQPPAAASAALAATLADLVERTNALSRLAETLESYIFAFVSTNSYDALAARELSKLEILDTRRQRLGVRLKAWVGSLAPLLPRLIAQQPALGEHAFFLEHTARQSRYLMSEELEALAAELCVDGGGAFGKLQGNVTSQLKVPFARNGTVEELPMTVVRNLCFDPDREVRRRAYEAEHQGWHSIRTTVAACLNGVKGTAATLARRRGRPSVLDASLDENRIDRPTLDALLGSIREYLPVFRRYLAAKAKKLGLPRMAWWDLFAPLESSHANKSWPEARAFIIDKFSGFSSGLGDYAKRAFDEGWIDAGPRDGKRGGAFCMSVLGTEESRVLMNYDGSFEQVMTLAHELGHGYHNECQRGLPPLRRGAPSTLAETASIFCETLVAESVLAEATPQEGLSVLEAQLAGATQVCIDISSRFLFESAVLERRTASELSPEELCELMQSAQRETYGDAVDPQTYHRYMWLWKPHYYAHQANFYNFPYAFGHLFGLGLFAVYRQEGAAFVPRYNALLRSTAEDYAAPLARRFGIDITQPEFWRQSLALIEGQIRRYEAL